MSKDFLLEKTLRKKNPELHRRFSDTVFSLQKILSGYKLLFPEYTDHTELHSIAVIDFCNALIGEEQAARMDADEIYVLLMACYLHDAGMGITKKDYEIFRDGIDMQDYLKENPEADITDIIRTYHHEFSGQFIRKYSGLFDIPSEEHLFAVIQVSRGHRKTDLFDETEYPAELRVPNGNTICLPYLAALVRLADEIDVAASRNPILLYDIEDLHNDIGIWHALKHRATRDLQITEESFVLVVETDDEQMMQTLSEMREKMQETLDYCRNVVEKRTAYRITQKTVKLVREEHGRGQDRCFLQQERFSTPDSAKNRSIRPLEP